MKKLGIDWQQKVSISVNRSYQNYSRTLLLWLYGTQILAGGHHTRKSPSIDTKEIFLKVNGELSKIIVGTNKDR